MLYVYTSTYDPHVFVDCQHGPDLNISRGQFQIHKNFTRIRPNPSILIAYYST